MRGTSSNHTESIRTQAIHVWPSYLTKTFRPNLNLPLLSKIVSIAAGENLDAVTSNSGKRKASEPASKTRSTKRTRTSRGSQDHDDEESSDGESRDSTVAPEYPSIRVSENQPSVDSETVPVLHHAVEIQYVKRDMHSSGTVTPDIETRKKWDEEDEALQDVVFALSGSLPSSKTFDLGEIRFGEHEGRAVGVSCTPRYHADGDTWLFLVPALMIDPDSNDLASSPSADLLLACRTLQDAGLAHVDARLKMIVQPKGSLEAESLSLPFCLQLEITISLVLPAALDYSSRKVSSRKSWLALENAQRRLLRAVYISDDVASTTLNKPVTVSSFYSIMGPAPDLFSKTKEAVNAMQPDALLPTLLPFQCRSVGWLLEKEGMTISEDGSIVPQTSFSGFSFWKEVQEGNHTWYLNRLSGELLAEMPTLPNIYGGMLAEEPGLGKTLETIALILLNPAPPDWNPSLTRWDPIAHLDVKAVKTTLIVTPPSLISQWKDELTAHAPSLKIFIYDGWTKLKVPMVNNKLEHERLSRLPKKRKPKGKAKSGDEDMDVDEDEALTKSADGKLLEWCSYVQQFDVVITTYPVLRSEIYVARPAPDRPRREDALYTTYGRARSPLVMVEWKRVVMDEVQMVGGGKAAEMVSLIPRLSSLAVSGTPAKAHISDLIHVLKFLRIDQLVGNLRLWNRLLKPGFSDEFTAFLQHYGIRTAKASVTSELTIPQQTRYLVGIELGKVERHVYDQTLEAILLELGLDARGVAASSGWTVNSNLLRISIRRLRGICTHPQVGQLQKKGDGLYKPGALKTMDAVLQAMRDQNWKSLMEDWKLKIHALIRCSQLQRHDESNDNRYRQALETIELAEKDANKHIDEIKDMLAKHDAKGKALIEEAALIRQKQQESGVASEEGKDKGKNHAADDDDRESAGGDEDPEEKDLPKTPAGEEHRTKRRAIMQRLREGLLILHQVKFLQGDAHHVLENSLDENAAYQAAEQLRRQLLKATEEEAKKAVLVLSSNASRKNLTHAALVTNLPFLGQGGIRSADLMEEINTLIENVLNEQSDLMWKWRTRIMGLLTQPLNPADDEVDGQEYQRTLDDQGEAETYLQAYAALLADRREALVNERTLLAAHEVREKYLRQTKAAMKAATAEVDVQLEAAEGLDFQPEHEVLHKELSIERKHLLLHLQGRAIKSVLMNLNAVSAKILQDSHPEKILVKDAIGEVRRFMSEQSSLHDQLEADLALLRKAFNQRILYFRQLQEISDSVREVEWEEESVTAALQVCQTEKAELEAKMNTTRARQRYLDNLSEQGAEVGDDDDKTCILCRHDFARGYITQCGHVFCELCMKQWLLRKQGKTCPVCRVAVDPNTVQRFTVSTVDMEPPPQPIAGEPAPQSRRQIVYNTIDPSLVENIQSMETYGDFGSKIQSLVRHLLYLKLADPGAKSIVFSAWADSLNIVEWALRDNGIKCLRIDQKSKGEHATHKFRKDPDILVLLLHGERENAGLNITCASRVFLLESVVHHSFEIQAIARIDRLGQTRPTEVYCYYAEDTIERNILDLAARKGLSLYTKDNSIGTVSVSPFNQDYEQVIDDPDKSKVLQKGDFIHKVDDMLAILFPHMFEDLQFLLPPTALVPAGSIEAEDVEMGDAFFPLSIPAIVQVNAVAGPSRLH